MLIVSGCRERTETDYSAFFSCFKARLNIGLKYLQFFFPRLQFLFLRFYCLSFVIIFARGITTGTHFITTYAVIIKIQWTIYSRYSQKQTIAYKQQNQVRWLKTTAMTKILQQLVSKLNIIVKLRINSAKVHYTLLINQPKWHHIYTEGTNKLSNVVQKSANETSKYEPYLAV